MRIPIAVRQKDCLKICQCSSQGVVERCQAMPCYTLDSCWLANRKIGKQLKNSVFDNEQYEMLMTLQKQGIQIKY